MDSAQSVDNELPIVSVAPLIDDRSGDVAVTAAEIRKACRQHGFFYITDHSVDEDLQDLLVECSQQFFALDLSEKLAIRMALAGRAWRGYFPVGEELTSGQPDLKEGLYFGAELDESDARVRDGLPLHGRNLFPASPREMQETVLDYMDAMSSLGFAVMRGIALSLDLDPSYFDRLMADPFILFRIFHYPPHPPDGDEHQWGVGEHSDYGVLTILKQDDTGGLQVKVGRTWIDAPPVPGSFVCNIGDMLEKMTGGVYRSTPHRVRNVTDKSRLSFPFFFDPSFDARITPIAVDPDAEDREVDDRWDGQDVHEFDGTYGEYLLDKVSKVFPDLA